MALMRGAVMGLGWLGAVALASLPAAAQDSVVPAPESGAPEVALPAVPDVTLNVPPAADLAPPELPEAPLDVRSIASENPALPPLPDAGVIITYADQVRAALAAVLPGIDKLAAHLPRREREALVAYYEVHPPLFVGEGHLTPIGAAVGARLAAAAEDGLDPNDYRVPAFGLAAPTYAAAAEAEIRLAAAAVAYARDARGARIDLAKISKLVTPKLDLPSTATVLSAVAKARNAGDALEAFNPPHPGYRALKDRLADLRVSRPSAGAVRVPAGPPLRVGMRDARVPLIRARFRISAEADETAYDGRVASMVADFQRQKGLPANGVLTPQTAAALSGAATAPLEHDLIANMERWRWLPADLGARHIVVNIPEFRLRLYEANGVVHATKVIVGKTETPTPIFSDEMETVIVNPSWTVPPSILKKEFLPGLAADPLYAERRGFRVYRRNGQISIQQPPGERNALGFIKFLFPNQHSVYLHDTPSRSLFGAERRAFSHGCVRVEQPFHLAEEILVNDGAWTEKKLRAMIGKGERPIRLRRTLPIHITYFTTSIDDSGQLRSFDDLYGVNRKVKVALGL